jgi:endoglucanase
LKIAPYRWAARVLAASALVAAWSFAVPASAGAASPPTLKVAGNRLVDGSGAPLRVAGVNRSGAEYACAQGWGIFDGPTDDASVSAIASWGVNAVRVPLNEDCWLGINGVKSAYAGSNYQSAIRSFVNRLQAHGLAVILDLHWGAPGRQLATGQEQAPDADHALAFWSSVAGQYKGVSGIAYDLFNEPHDISWSCWRNGCTIPGGWKATGMQQLVNAVRSAGATQPAIAEGLNWGGDLSGWLANKPNDSAGQLVAGWHVYNFSGCNTTSCWDANVAPVAQQVPVLATEIGENDCAGGFLDTLLPWADAHSIGYLAWAWNTASCGAGPSLISDYSGTPTAYGAAFKGHLANPSPTPPPAPSPIDPAARFDFEDGTTQGWSVRWGSTLSVANETGVAASGSHGLAIDVSGSGYPAVGVDSGLSGVGPGTQVTYKVWAPNGVSAAVAPMVFDSNWNVTVLAPQSLSPGWNTVSFTLPSSLNGVRVLGLQVNDATGWAGRIVLDDVTWQPIRFDFEDGTVQGWSVRWGSTLALSNETGLGFTGTHGLAIDISGTGYPALGVDSNLAGLGPGASVTYHVWAPADVSAGVAPMVFDGNWNVTVLGNQPLSPGWNTVSFTIPNVNGLKVLGLQVNDGSGWAGRLVLDSVAY